MASRAIDNFAQPGGIVGVLRAVYGRQREFSRAPAFRQRAAAGFRTPAIFEGGIQHDVSRPHRFFAQSLLAEVFHGQVRWTEEQIAQVIGDHAVDFLRHAAAIASQSGFDMRDGETRFGGDQSAGERRIGIAVKQNPIRLFGFQNRLQALQHLRRFVFRAIPSPTSRS